MHDTGLVVNLVGIAKRVGMDKARGHKIMKMVRLAPRYVKAIAKGKDPLACRSNSLSARRSCPTGVSIRS